MTKYEAAVIGAGPTGLAAALALARMGIEVALVGPGAAAPACAGASRREPAIGSRQSAVVDQRTTALVGPSIALLRNLGVLAAEPPVGQTAADCRLPTAAGSAPASAG